MFVRKYLKILIYNGNNVHAPLITTNIMSSPRYMRRENNILYLLCRLIPTLAISNLKTYQALSLPRFGVHTGQHSGDRQISKEM